jgi:hypothetical protein
MSIPSVNSQRPAVQNFQTTQPTPRAQRKEGPALQQDPLAALTKALEALEKAVQSLSTKGFNNNQSVAQQAGTNLGQSGAAKGNQFDWGNMLGGGSTFEPQQQYTAPTAPVQQKQDTSFLTGTGGGPGGDTHVDHGLHLGNTKSGGGGSGIRVGSDGANN